MHEHAPKYPDTLQGSSDRTFGLVFACFFVIIALQPLLHGGTVGYWALGLSGSFLGFAVLKPHALAGLNRSWTKIGLWLHRIVSPIVLGVIFYLLMVPIGFLMRLFGKDPLRLDLDAAAETYWLQRDASVPRTKSFDYQF